MANLYDSIYEAGGFKEKGMSLEEFKTKVDSDFGGISTSPFIPAYFGDPDNDSNFDVMRKHKPEGMSDKQFMDFLHEKDGNGLSRPDFAELMGYDPSEWNTGAIHGLANSAELVAGLLDTTADIFEWEGLRESSGTVRAWAEEKRNSAEQPEVATFDDIGFGSDRDALDILERAGKMAAFNIAAQGPQVGAVVGTAIAAKPLGLAAAAGGLVAYALSTGEAYNELIEQGVEEPGEIAAILGVPVALLDYWSISKTLGLGKITKQKAIKGMTDFITHKMAPRTVAGMAREGLTETAQEAILFAGSRVAAGKEVNWEEFRNRGLTAGLTGSLIGGGMGAAGSFVPDSKTKEGKPSKEDTEATETTEELKPTVTYDAISTTPKELAEAYEKNPDATITTYVKGRGGKVYERKRTVGEVLGPMADKEAWAKRHIQASVDVALASGVEVDQRTIDALAGKETTTQESEEAVEQSTEDEADGTETTGTVTTVPFDDTPKAATTKTEKEPDEEPEAPSYTGVSPVTFDGTPIKTGPDIDAAIQQTHQKISELGKVINDKEETEVERKKALALVPGMQTKLNELRGIRDERLTDDQIAQAHVDNPGAAVQDVVTSQKEQVARVQKPKRQEAKPKEEQVPQERDTQQRDEGQPVQDEQEVSTAPEPVVETDQDIDGHIEEDRRAVGKRIASRFKPVGASDSRVGSFVKKMRAAGPGTFFTGKQWNGQKQTKNSVLAIDYNINEDGEETFNVRDVEPIQPRKRGRPPGAKNKPKATKPEPKTEEPKGEPRTEEPTAEQIAVFEESMEGVQTEEPVAEQVPEAAPPQVEPAATEDVDPFAIPAFLDRRKPKEAVAEVKAKQAEKKTEGVAWEGVGKQKEALKMDGEIAAHLVKDDKGYKYKLAGGKRYMRINPGNEEGKNLTNAREYVIDQVTEESGSAQAMIAEDIIHRDANPVTHADPVGKHTANDAEIAENLQQANEMNEAIHSGELNEQEMSDAMDALFYANNRLEELYFDNFILSFDGTKFAASIEGDTLSDEVKESIPTLVAEATALAKKINPRIKAHFGFSFWGRPSDMAAHNYHDLNSKELARVAGYNIGEKIWVAINRGVPFNVLRTVLHESWHSLENLLTPKQQALLRNKFASVDPRVAHEEIIAEAFSAFYIKTAIGGDGRPLPSVKLQNYSLDFSKQFEDALVKQAFGKIRKFLRRLGNLLRGMGFQTYDDIFADVYSGDMGKRIAAKTRTSPVLEVSNALRTFNEWFGDSKVVDARGEPMKVYTGVSEQASDSPSQELGIFFGESTATANIHSVGRPQGRVMPSYLNVSNPAEMTHEQLMQTVGDKNLARQTQEQLAAAGHDGIRVKTPEDVYWVAFSPSQVKSIWDKGVVNRDDGRLRYASEAISYSALEDQDIFVDGPDFDNLSDLSTYISKNIQTKYINSDLSAMETFQWLVENYEKFIQAARGRGDESGTVSWKEEVQVAIKEMSAGLGVTTEKLNKILKDHRAAPAQILAIRHLNAMGLEALTDNLKRVAEDGSDSNYRNAFEDYLRQVLFLEVLYGVRAEAGRALNIWKAMVPNSTLKSAIPLPQLMRIKENEGGVKDLVDKLVKAQEGGSLLEKVRKESKPGWVDYFLEYWINALLSGPKTHIVNMTSNALVQAWTNVPENFLAAFFGTISPNRQDRVTWTEAWARMTGGWKSSRAVMSAAYQTMMSEEPTSWWNDKVDYKHRKVIPGLLGRTLRIPSRMLMTEDEIFKMHTYHSEVSALANRYALQNGYRLGGDAYSKMVQNIMNDPQDIRWRNEIHQQAVHMAGVKTFTDPAPKLVAGLMNMANQVPILRLVFPFIRTPYKIVEFAMARTPLGVFGKGFKADFKAGGARRHQAEARIVLGTTVMMGVFVLASQGLITGSGPSDPEERKMWRENNEPSSFTLKNGKVSFARTEPLGTILTLGADLYDIFNILGDERLTQDEQFSKAISLLVFSIAKNIQNKTFLQGITNLMQAFNDPDRYGAWYLHGMAGTMMPTIVAQVAQATDPELKTVDTYVRKFMERTPGQRDKLAPKPSYTGERIIFEDMGNSDIAGFHWEQMVNPLYWKSVKDSDGIMEELQRLEKAGATIPKMPKDNVYGIKLTPQQFFDFVNFQREPAFDLLKKVVKSQEYHKMNDNIKITFIKTIMGKFADAGKAKFYAKYPEVLQQVSRAKSLKSLPIDQKRYQRETNAAR